VKIVVTGGAGFIGSHLTERLATDGHEVDVIDCFTDYYDTSIKRRNCSRWMDMGARLHERDLVRDQIDDVVDGAEIIFHLAAQPGVRQSWTHFEDYTSRNLVASQRLFEASSRATVQNVIVASSSSVYGNATELPTPESATLRPHSPYGITKKALEDLAHAHAANFGLSCVLLRYFTVYGPRQRPDMAFTRLCAAAIDGTPFPLFGSGGARRSFTYVDDAVEATVLAAGLSHSAPLAINVCGGESAGMLETIAMMERLRGHPLPIQHHPGQVGDVRTTDGSSRLASEILGFAPSTGLEDGLTAQIRWYEQEVSAGGRNG
jgi:UDP-glucuronate 4-epimerase